MKLDKATKKAIAEIKAVNDWREEQRTKETVLLIDKYYTFNGHNFHARKIGEGEWQVEELEEMPFIKFNQVSNPLDEDYE